MFGFLPISEKIVLGTLIVPLLALIIVIVSFIVSQNNPTYITFRRELINNTTVINYNEQLRAWAKIINVTSIFRKEALTTASLYLTIWILYLAHKVSHP